MSTARVYQLLIVSLVCVFDCSGGAKTTLRPVPLTEKLEAALLANYNRKHRPVKKESTTLKVSVVLSITHIEKINEYEQTITIHGHLWSSWIDEYLTWKPEDWNNTKSFNTESYKLWQPALSLYNSGRGNSWHLYLHALPAVIENTGRVFATGSFSFHVTCLFDFSAWPYDVQRCPIVIADWVYDLSKVNLSETTFSSLTPKASLNFDPFSTNESKFLSGWELLSTWRRHCYWGHQGCKDDQPADHPEWYWSLLEFGVVIRRHAPYIRYTVILPTIITSILTLTSFWINTYPYPMCILILNVGLQAIYGWDLVRSLPPGSGSVPGLVVLYGVHLSLTVFALAYHIIADRLIQILPEHIHVPLKISEITEKIRASRAFKANGLSFDPQSILNNKDSPFASNSPSTSTTGLGSFADINPTDAVVDGPPVVVVEVENVSQDATESNEMSLDEDQPDSKMSSLAVPSLHLTTNAFAFIRRSLFFLFALYYAVAIPYYILF